MYTIFHGIAAILHMRIVLYLSQKGDIKINISFIPLSLSLCLYDRGRGYLLTLSWQILFDAKMYLQWNLIKAHH